MNAIFALRVERDPSGVCGIVASVDDLHRITLEQFAPGTLYAPHATSLRMSDLGYRNKSQAGVQISVNSLDEYVRDLTAAVSTPHPEYQRLGVKVDSEYRQLNANLLHSLSTTGMQARADAGE